MQVTTIGLDLAKRVFQVHGVNAAGKLAVRRKLQRSEMADFFAALPRCLVGIEACATAHHWARLIGAAGHDIRLIPPSYVMPYVRRSKTDAADAEAICEAVGRPNMRFVPVKSVAQQAALLHHRARDLLVRQRTMLINALRGHLGEFGIIAPAGRHRVPDLLNLLQDAEDAEALAREALRSLIAELHALRTTRRGDRGGDRARAQGERRQRRLRYAVAPSMRRARGCGRTHSEPICSPASRLPTSEDGAPGTILRSCSRGGEAVPARRVFRLGARPPAVAGSRCPPVVHTIRREALPEMGDFAIGTRPPSSRSFHVFPLPYYRVRT